MDSATKTYSLFIYLKFKKYFLTPLNEFLIKTKIQKIKFTTAY